MWSIKEKQKFHLDDPRATTFHRDLILSKPFLRKLYVEWYSGYLNETKDIPGKKLEIGSGGGFIKMISPEVITSDILELPDCDMCFSAENMPFTKGEIGSVFMLNVLHHIPDTEAFFDSCTNILDSGGVVYMVEPANTLFSRLIYKNIHHEPFDTKVKEWAFPSKGPLSDANGALPWLIFKRDRARFNERFPDLELVEYLEHTPFRYLLTGGLSFKSIVPGWSFGLVSLLERMFKPFFPFIGMFVTIVVRKK